VVHILQHPTSRPTTRSTHNTIVNASKKNLSPLPVGTYTKLTKNSTHGRHQPNEGKRDLEAERVRGLVALRSLPSTMNHSAEKRQEMHFVGNKEKEKWIDDYVERLTTVAGMRVPDAQTAIM
jgi:hypothetical protein